MRFPSFRIPLSYLDSQQQARPWKTTGAIYSFQKQHIATDSQQCVSQFSLKTEVKLKRRSEPEEEVVYAKLIRSVVILHPLFFFMTCIEVTFCYFRFENFPQYSSLILKCFGLCPILSFLSLIWHNSICLLLYIIFIISFVCLSIQKKRNLFSDRWAWSGVQIKLIEAERGKWTSQIIKLLWGLLRQTLPFRIWKTCLNQQETSQIPHGHSSLIKETVLHLEFGILIISSQYRDIKFGFLFLNMC